MLIPSYVYGVADEVYYDKNGNIIIEFEDSTSIKDEEFKQLKPVAKVERTDDYIKYNEKLQCYTNVVEILGEEVEIHLIDQKYEVHLGNKQGIPYDCILIFENYLNFYTVINKVEEFLSTNSNKYFEIGEGASIYQDTQFIDKRTYEVRYLSKVTLDRDNGRLMFTLDNGTELSYPKLKEFYRMRNISNRNTIVKIDKMGLLFQDNEVCYIVPYYADCNDDISTLMQEGRAI